MSNLQNFVDSKVLPHMQKLGTNKALKAITSGMMSTMPLSLGVSIIAIVGNFPIAAWVNFLNKIGIKTHMAAIIGGSTEIIALFLAYNIAYYYAKEKKTDATTCGTLSLATYMILMPQSILNTDGSISSAIERSYLGSQGIFVAIIFALLVTSLYAFLKAKGFYIRLPENIPEMVSKSLSPAFISMIIFAIVLFIRFGFGFLEYDNAFDFISKMIAKPLMSVGTNTGTLIILYVIVNLAWCFGIHPSAITSVIVPVLYAGIAANVAAFQAGQVLPFLEYIIVYKFINTGGTGNTLGLAIDMCLFSKSKRFKTLGKMAIVPNIFNINEPVVFGTPILYNPIFMLPMALTAIVSGGIGFLLVRFGIYAQFNPAVSVPWTTPAPINHLLTAGVIAALGSLIVIAATAAVYYPFFKYADKLALKEETEQSVLEEMGNVE
jgi:PTS system, lactose/cellobiose family IIC component